MLLYKSNNNQFNKYICYHLNLKKDHDIDYEKIYELFGTNMTGIFTDKYLFEIKYISKNTPWSSNIMKICKKSNLNYIENVSKSYIYILDSNDDNTKKEIFSNFHDKMTQTYKEITKNNNYNDSTKDIESLNKKLNIFAG